MGTTLDWRHTAHTFARIVGIKCGHRESTVPRWTGGPGGSCNEATRSAGGEHSAIGCFLKTFCVGASFIAVKTLKAVPESPSAR